MLWIFNEKTLLTIIAALGYGVATIFMKILSERMDILIPVALGLVLLITVVAEIALLRRVDLGLAYVAVIATESMLVLGYALMIGEGLSGREWVGAGFIIAGATLVSY